MGRMETRIVGAWSQAGGLPGTRVGTPGLITARTMQDLRSSGRTAISHDEEKSKEKPAEFFLRKIFG